MSAGPFPVVVLVSGSGSNLQAIIDRAASGTLPIAIRAVISNRPAAYALERARQAGIEALGMDHREFPDRAAFDRALLAEIDARGPGLVVLAGFMRIFTTAFVEHYRGRLINIHPSLLPAFPGLDTHRRALEAGAREHGATVHFVVPELDAGPTITNAVVPILDGDDAESLAARVLEQEHRILPTAILWFAEGRLRLTDGHAVLDGRPISNRSTAPE